MWSMTAVWSTRRARRCGAPCLPCSPCRRSQRSTSRVSSTRIWDGRPPASGLRALRFHISRLRAELGIADLIVTVGSAYQLEVSTDLLELVDRFETSPPMQAPWPSCSRPLRGTLVPRDQRLHRVDHERRGLDQKLDSDHHRTGVTSANSPRATSAASAISPGSASTTRCASRCGRSSFAPTTRPGTKRTRCGPSPGCASTCAMFTVFSRGENSKNSNCRSSTTTCLVRHRPAADLLRRCLNPLRCSRGLGHLAAWIPRRLGAAALVAPLRP